MFLTFAVVPSSETLFSIVRTALPNLLLNKLKLIKEEYEGKTNEKISQKIFRNLLTNYYLCYSKV